MSHNREEYELAVVAGKALFIRKGYKNVSVADIVQATGMNRYTIYTAFGAKLDFFVACVKDYCENAIRNLTDRIENSTASPYDAIRLNLYAAVDEMAKMNAGCLVCENLGQMKTEAPALVAYCVDFFSKKEALYRELFERAALQGLLNPHSTPSTAAASLIIFKFGLSNEIKCNSSIEDIYRKIDEFVAIFVKNPDAAP